MLAAFFDDSGTHSDSPLTTVAGYVARKHDWEKFEHFSTGLFEAYRITYFHAKEFDQATGQFRSWNTARQIGFATDWLEIAGHFVDVGYGMSMINGDFSAARKFAPSSAHISKFSYCLQIAITRILQNSKIRPAIEKEGLEIFIEGGNKNNNGALNDLKELIYVNQIDPWVKDVREIPKKQPD